MNQIIHETNLYIDKCADCRERNCCHWFNAAAESVVLDDVTPERYASMTYEERACKVFTYAGRPTACSQKTFDGMMQRVEGLLEVADMPATSKELLDILNKLARLEKRLNRLDSDCRDVFDAAVRAVVERCLSAIDYHFLEMGIDVYGLIQNIHSDYHRTSMLHQNYVEGVVNILLSKAYKPSVEQIVACSLPLFTLIPPAPSTPTYSVEDDLPDLGESETDPASEIVDDAELGSELPYDDEWPFDDELPFPVKKTTTDLFNDLLDIVASEDAMKHIAAVSLSFGARPPFFSGSDETYFDSDFVAKNISSEFECVFSDIKLLAKCLVKEIRKRKSDDNSINAYLTTVLSRFSKVSQLLYPEPVDESHIELAMVFDASEQYKRYSMEAFNRAWSEGTGLASAQYNPNSEEYYSMLPLWIHAVYKKENEDVERGPLTAIAELRMTISLFEAAIEGALLINGIGHDFMYYEDLAGVHLSGKISELEVANVCKLTVAAVRHMVKDLKHPYQFASKEADPVSDYFHDMVSKPSQQNSSAVVSSDNNKQIVKDTRVEVIVTEFPEEIKQAIEDGNVREDGTIIGHRSDFVLYCHKKGYFSPRNQEAGWQPIHNMLKDSKGRPISAKQYRQTYQDLGRDGRVPID